MSHERRHGPAGEYGDDATHEEVGRTPGKRSLTEMLPKRTHFGEAAVASGSTAPGAQAAGPTGAADGSTADPMGPKKLKVTITSLDKAPAKGPAISFSAKDYAELYQQVKARADSGLEAGSVSRGWSEDTVFPEGSDEVVEAKYDIPLTMSLPEWPARSSVSEEHQKKYDSWAASVKAHEDKHVEIYRTGYAALKTAVIGPTKAKVTEQSTAVDDATEQAQKDFDAANQPAGLPIPGGTEKVKSSGAGGDGGGEAPPSE